MIQAAYKKFIKQLPLILSFLVLAVIIVFFRPSSSSIFINIVVLLAFAWPLVQIGIFISKIETFRKRLNSLSADERKEVEAALHANNSLGDIYFTERFVILHQCLRFNAITLAVIRRTSISDTELLPKTPRRNQQILIKTIDSPHVYRVEILLSISDEQMINFATEIKGGTHNWKNDQSMKAAADAENTKHNTPIYRQPFIPMMTCGGLMIVYCVGMWLLTAYLPDVIEGFRRSNLFSLLVPGYTYLMAMIMVLITPITYFKRKGNVENKFLWVVVSGMSVFFACFMLYMSTYF